MLSMFHLRILRFPLLPETHLKSSTLRQSPNGGRPKAPYQLPALPATSSWSRPQGLGKTMIAQNIAHAAVFADRCPHIGRKIKFTSSPDRPDRLWRTIRRPSRRAEVQIALFLHL